MPRVRHRIDGLENTRDDSRQNNRVRHRIDGLENQAQQTHH